MPSERVQRQIDELLSDAESAIKAADWERVRDRARAIIALDEGNEDAAAYLKAAGANLIGEASSSPRAPAPLETCQIEYATTKSFLGMPAGQYYFWAKAISPESGEYSAGASPAFNPSAMQGLRNWATKNYDLNPQSWDKNATSAHRALVDLLTKEGWEPTPFQGHEWWQQTFQRPVRREGDGWFIFGTLKKWNGYWMCDPQADPTNDAELQEAMKQGKVRKDQDGVWVEEQFFIQMADGEHWHLVSVVPTSLETHMVTMQAKS
jgi:hypothetical protein